MKTLYQLDLDDLDVAQARLSFARANLMTLGMCVGEGGNSPSGEILDGAIMAICELLTATNDVLSRGKVVRHD